MAGGSMFALASLLNTGNAVENRLSVKATVSSSPPLPGLLAFFTVAGGERAVASEVPVLVPAGGSLDLRLDVLIPDDAPLNTRFVLRFDILGAVDENDLPKPMTVEALVMLNQQRSITLESGLMQAGDIPYGTSAMVQINQTSTSTMNENTVVTLSGEEGWQITCDKRLVNASGVVIDFSSGHITPQANQLRCEVLRMAGPLQGELSIESRTVDGFLRSTDVLNISFEAPPAEETMSTTTLIGGGIGALVFIAGLLFVLRGRGNDEEYHDTTEVAPHGPPVSESTSEKAVPAVETAVPLQAGPPASGGPPITTAPPTTAGPPLPEGGLPVGWTQEQWEYYGQQYLDGTL